MRRAMLVMGLVLPLVVAGCQQDEEIKSYEVKHPQREKIRTLAAILPDANNTYFVVLMGPEAAVAEQKKPFDDFVASIRLQDKKDKPVIWTTPEGWDEEGGGGDVRIAGFAIKVGSTKMEATLTKFPKLGGPNQPNSLADNLNRWRGKIELPPVGSDEVEKVVRRDKIDGREVILADMTGLGVHKAPSKAQNPHAGGMPPLDLQKFGKPGKARLPFVFDPPAAWNEMARLPQFAVAAYEVSKGKQRAEITITSAGGELVENVNRWRGQIGLPKAGRAEVERDARPSKVAGFDGHYVDLANPNSNMPKNHILGVIVDVDRETWFIKMAGPTELVSDQKANFEAFVRSFKRSRE